MSGDSRFRRNVTVVAAIHLLVIAGAFFLTRDKKAPSTISWLDGGSPPASASAAESPQATPAEPTPTPTPEPRKKDAATSAKTDPQRKIVLPTTTPKAAVETRSVSR